MAEKNFLVGQNIDANNVDFAVTKETVITTNSATTIASFNASEMNASEFSVSATQGLQTTTKMIMVGHDGTTVSSTQYGESSIGTAAIAVAGTGAITWVTQTSNFGNSIIYSVAYGNNLWVAGGYYGQIRTSTDAVTWVTQTSNFPNNYSGIIRSVAYGNNLWVAGGDYGNIRTSTDAITWTTRTSNFPNNYTGTIRSVAYSNNLWVAAGGGDYGTSAQLRTSTDAITWTTRTSNFGNSRIRSVAHGNNLWVAGGESSQLRTSAVDVILGIPLTLSADISGSDVRLRATVLNAATTSVTVKVRKKQI